jgi:tRNA threonylcarbamoyl adenosine modification protein YeaZ
LAIDDQPPLEERLEERGAHAQRLPGMVASVLAQAGITVQDLTALVLSAGPGSYTGLRIGASFAKGLLFAREIPFYAASTLAGLAMAVVDPTVGQIHAVIDARRTHVYHQGFAWDGRALHPIEFPVLRELREVEGRLGRGDVLCGTGLHRFAPEVLAACRCYDSAHIRASALYELYQNADTSLVQLRSIEDFEPDYRGNPYQ